MALKPGLSAKLSQRIALTPAMRQGLSLLRMPAAELNDEVFRLAAENPLLLVTEPTAYRAARPSESPAMEMAQRETLGQSLRRQIAMMPLDRPVAQLARFLTGDLTDDGYLDSSPEELSEALGLPHEQVTAAVRALQACQPAGVAARDLAECLALQLIDKGVPEDDARLICRHLDLLFEGDMNAAAESTGWPRERLERIAALIRTLSPRPGADYTEPARPLVPDIVVECDEMARVVATLNHPAQPSVRIDAELAARMKSTGMQDRGYRGQAEALLGALSFRGKTVLRVANALVAHHLAFFSGADGGLAPLTRSALAERVGLHPSTVGRAVAHKSLAFSGVVYPLCHFLSPALAGADGRLVSVHDAQRKIRRLIAEEAPGAALSDAEIAAVLKSGGVDIARRTVAKYRGCMNIPSSFERNRRHAASDAGVGPERGGSSRGPGAA